MAYEIENNGVYTPSCLQAQKQRDAMKVVQQRVRSKKQKKEVKKKTTWIMPSYVLYGVKYIDPVSLAPCSGQEENDEAAQG